jgi:hypothetical protein
MKETSFAFPDLSCDLVDRPPWEEARSTKPHESRRAELPLRWFVVLAKGKPDLSYVIAELIT